MINVKKISPLFASILLSISCPAQSWPDSSNTGYQNAPGYTGSLTSWTGGSLVSGKTYSFIDFPGGIDLGSSSGAISNVKLYGCRFHGAAPYNKLVGLYGDNFTFDYCTFEPDVKPVEYVSIAQSYQYGLAANGGYYTHVGKLTVTHCNFWGFGNAIDVNPNSDTAKAQVYRDNYIHHAADIANSAYHHDGIGAESGSSTGSYVTIDHNRIESLGNTNGIAYQATGPYSYFTITNNLFGGFGYTVAILGSTSSHMVFTDNTFSTGLNAAWGPLYTDAFLKQPGSIWKRNKWKVPAGASWGKPGHDGWYWIPTVAARNGTDDTPFVSQIDFGGPSNFSISGGKIIDPDGNVYNARGINNGLNNNMSDILKFFPCINFIRWPSGNYQDTAFFRSFINYMSARKIVVELEYHPWPLINAQSGSALTSETAWYTKLAKAYGNNPYVWFGTMNEPQGGDITAEQVAVYNAIRNAGANNIIMMEVGVGSGDPGQEGPASLNSASYTSMTNIVWDFHFYGWESNYSTNQATVNSKLLGAVNTGTGVRSIQQITSADGVVPVINGEFGNSTNGSTVDANGDQVIYAVTVYARSNNYTAGYAAWHWTAASDPLADRLVYNGALTSYGNQIAAAIANDCTPASSSPNATFCTAPAAPVIDGAAESSWDLIQANSFPNTIAGTATSSSDISATYKTTWDNNNLYILVNVTDDAKKNDSGTNYWDDDAIELFIDGNNDKATSYDGNDRQYIFRWNDNTVHQISQGGSSNPAGVTFAQSNTANGYIMEIQVAWSALGVTPAAAKLVGFDVHVDDDDDGGVRDNKIAWYAQADNSYADPSTFGTIQLSSSTCAQLNSSFCSPASAPVIDGTEESLWSGIQANNLPHTIIGTATSTSDISATYKATWDNNNLYILANVTDDVKKNDSGTNYWDDDGIEIYIDGNNDKATSYDSNDRQYAFRWNDNTVHQLSQGGSSNPTGVTFAQTNTANGYIMEVSIAWSALGVTASAGKIVGLDVHVNDDDDGAARDNKISWIATSDVSWQDPSTFGNIKLSSSPCPTATGIASIESSSAVQVYPNPFSTNFTVSISNETVLHNAVMKIYDVFGKEVKVVSINDHEIRVDEGELSNGLYFYRITSNNEKIAEGKLILED